MKDRWGVQGKERRICAVNESTLSTADAPCGEGLYGGAFAAFFIGAMPESGFLVTGYPYDKKVRKTQERSLRKMSDRALLGRFLS